MSIHIAVVDDDRADADSLIEHISRFSKETGMELNPVWFRSPGAFLSEEVRNFSLVILDIDMPGMNGVECARALRNKDPQAVLMFVTNMPQYALAGYEVEAVDYVLKPIGYADFSLKLRKAFRFVDQSKERDILLQTGTEMLRVPVWEILYVESDRHYLSYHTADREIRVRGTMAEAEKELERLQFARCNSGYLVNLRRITSIRREEVVLGKAEIKISRGYRNDFLERFTAFAGGLGL